MVMLPIPESMCTMRNVFTSTQSENGKIKREISFFHEFLTFFFLRSSVDDFGERK